MNETFCQPVSIIASKVYVATRVSLRYTLNTCPFCSIGVNLNTFLQSSDSTNIKLSITPEWSISHLISATYISDEPLKARITK